jgi:hypothetical protein
MYFLVALVASHCVFVSSSDLGTSLVAGVVVLALLLSVRAFCALLFLQPFVSRQKTPAVAGDPPGHARARFSGRIWLWVGELTTGLQTRFGSRGREQDYTIPQAQAVGIVR